MRFDGKSLLRHVNSKTTVISSSGQSNRGVSQLMLLLICLSLSIQLTLVKVRAELTTASPAATKDDYPLTVNCIWNASNDLQCVFWTETHGEYPEFYRNPTHSVLPRSSSSGLSTTTRSQSQRPPIYVFCPGVVNAASVTWCRGFCGPA